MAQPVRGNVDSEDASVVIRNNETFIGDEGPTGYERFAAGRV